MKIHIVQKGETLWEIATHYGIDFIQLQEANPQLSSPDMLMPGMKIMVPAPSKKIIAKEKSKKSKQKNSIKPLKMKEDDHKKKTELNMSIPSLDSLELPILKEEEKKSSPQKQKKKLKKELIKEDNKQAPKHHYETPKYHPQQHHYPIMPAPACCCQCYCAAHYMRLPYPEHGRNMETQYVGHLPGFYYDPSPGMSQSTYSNHAETYPSHHVYENNFKGPDFPHMEKENKDQV